MNLAVSLCALRVFPWCPLWLSIAWNCYNNDFLNRAFKISGRHDLSMGLQMRLLIRRSAAVLNKAAAGVVCLGLLAGCGDASRPVANPIPQPGGNPVGTVENAIILAANGTGTNPGTTANFNVSGDTVVAVENVSANPVHAAIIGGAVVVANKNSGTLSVYSVSAGPNASVQTPSFPSTVPNLPDAHPTFVARTDNPNVPNFCGRWRYLLALCPQTAARLRGEYRRQFDFRHCSLC